MGGWSTRREVVVTAVMAVAAAVVAAGLHLAEAAWIKSACQSNLVQVGRAVVIYAEAHGGRYPDTLGDMLTTTDISPAAFVCPASADVPAIGPTTRAVADNLTAGGHVSYVYVGRGLTTRTVTPSTVIAYEPLANHGDGGNVLYGDGHAEWLGRGPLAAVAAHSPGPPDRR